MARVGFETDEAQLVLITRTRQLSKQRELVMELRHRLPFVQSIMQNVNLSKTSLIFGDETIKLWGKETIDERLGLLQFSLSPRAFFQLNPEQTVKLYDAVQQAAKLTGKEIVVDAYCGVGTIGLWLASQAKEVHGMDSIKEAIEDARRNAERSDISNATFHVGEAEKLLPEWVKKGLKPDVIVVDPPRTGLHDRLLQALLDAKPKKLVYVSCNPATLAKDCKVLIKGGYKVKSVQPLDMFPHTAHVESVTLLARI